MNEPSRSKAYQKIKNQLLIVSLVFDCVLLLVFFYSGLSVFLKHFLTEYLHQKFVLNAAYTTIFCFGFYILHFPMHMFSGFTWEHKFELSNQSFGAWLKDDLKGAALTLVMALILVEAVYFFLGQFPRAWWIAAGSFWLFFSFILAKITPDVIVPLFYKYQHVGKESLKQRIFRLFGSCQVSLKDVYSIDLSTKSKKANAFLCGIGGGRRVVLSDTLLKDFSDEEIEVVVAHELAHYKHHDILKLLLANGVVVFAGFYVIHRYFQYALDKYQLSGMDDISFLPMALLSFSLFAIMTAPILNWFSRVIETDADRFALSQTRAPEVFVSMIQKLGEMNLADFQPGLLTELFLYDHPPIAKRIAFARRFPVN